MRFKGVGRSHEVLCGVADGMIFFSELGTSFLDLGTSRLMLQPVSDLVLAAAIADGETSIASKEFWASSLAVRAAMEEGPYNALVIASRRRGVGHVALSRTWMVCCDETRISSS